MQFNSHYIHLIDGGITDNLGIRSFYDVVGMMGGARHIADTVDNVPKYLVMIVVNAATHPENPMDRNPDTLSSAQVVGAVSRTQLSHYTIESLSLLEESFKEWAAELSTPTRPVTPFFIKLDFESIGSKKQRRFFNNMATSIFASGRRG